VPWTADSLQAYLRGGTTPLHGAAFGPMAPVVRNLAQVPDGDVGAIAGYVASVAGPPTAERQKKANELLARVTTSNLETLGSAGAAAPPGSAIFAGACATCHSETRAQGAAGAVNLALSSTVNAPDPRNALHVVLDGIRPAEGERGALMPGFSATLTDGQIAEVVGYARSRFSTQPAWSDLEQRVRRMREGKDQW
jgi:mono/diheme cytochrome c family protein